VHPLLGLIVACGTTAIWPLADQADAAGPLVAGLLSPQTAADR